MEAVLDQTWTSAARDQTRPRAARRAVAALFFINGMLIATWISRIPAVQSARGLSHGELGLALLMVALGAMIAMPLTGSLSARFGSDNVSRVTALLYCAALPALALASNTALFVVSLFVFGAAHGALDVAMNAQAVATERRYPEPIMSSFHALFSTGGLVGAGAGALIAAAGMNPLTHFTLVALVLGGALLLVLPHLLDSDRQPAGMAREKLGSKFPLPSRGLVALGAIALCTMAGEGAMADWAGVYLRTVIQTNEGIAAAGYAAFSLAMLVGRFAGDWLSARVDAQRLVQVSGLLAAAGMIVALTSGQPGVILGSFVCIGAGFSTVVPMVFSAAGRSVGNAPGVALASVTTMGYLGFLAGPPLIGFIAELLGLRLALGMIVLTSLLIAALAPNLSRPAGTVR